MSEINAEEFTQLANNFYCKNGLSADYNRIAIDSQLANYIATHAGKGKKFKVALCCICLNPPYWQYAKEMMDGAKQFFLPGHQVDTFFWSDIPEATYGANVVHTEPAKWPLPTLMRYSLMLQQEEKLKEYDYIFYIDVDMKFVNVVGDEILGQGLTAAQHPGYALRKEYWPPYEPNEDSVAYIKRPGRVINDNGKPRFMPLYYAGGIQGGTGKEFLKAMKEMKKMIDKDMAKNYIPIWNDESIWNKYLFLNPPDVVLTPSYVYPDSLIKEQCRECMQFTKPSYYVKLWGCEYQPKLVTITKKFGISAEGGVAVKRMLETT